MKGGRGGGGRGVLREAIQQILVRVEQLWNFLREYVFELTGSYSRNTIPHLHARSCLKSECKIEWRKLGDALVLPACM
jgi:hypothetical protein